MPGSHLRPPMIGQRLANRISWMILLSIGFAWSACFAAAPDEVRSGTLLLKSAADASGIEAMRVSTGFRAQVTGNVARVYVTQQFTNPTADWVEGLYVFPLSPDSAVDELVMHVGDRIIRGDIQQKAKARATYEQARNSGHQASLVDQERPNMFTTSVANIAPQSAITIEIAYLETIARRDGRYTLHLPLAITPRYNPNTRIDPAIPMAATLTRTANALFGATMTPERVTSPQQRVTVNVELVPGFALESVQSLHHNVQTTPGTLGKSFRLEGDDLPADRDFELVWIPAVVPEVQATLFAEREGPDTYALLMITPPEQTIRYSERREVEFIIDTSGSMSGPSIEQARAALQLGVDRLSDVDRFNIIRFSNDASSLFRAPQPVSAASRQQAGRFIASLQADGGTEMRAPLEMAFATPPTEGYLRQIVFVTDGGVSNETEIIDLIRKRIGSGRLFTVGIGGSPNAYFLQESAIAGHGSYTVIAQRERVRERMADLFRKIENPALVDLTLQWPDGQSADLASALPGDLYAGDPMVVLARLSAPLKPDRLVTLSGQSRGIAWVHQVAIASTSDQSGISKLWTRERIAALSRQKNFGADAARVEAEITDLALRHHLVTEFTSLVAVDTTPARPAGVTDRSEQAPTSAPAGSYWANTTGFVSTATPAPLLLLIGLTALGCGALLWLVPMRRNPSAAPRLIR